MRDKKTERFTISFLCLLFLLTFIPVSGYSAVPQTINYQGYLTDSDGNPIDGTVQMTFSIYDSETADKDSWIWQQPQTVDVTGGVYNVVLGGGATPNPIDLTFDIQYWLGIKVETNNEMTPRTALTSTGYAFRAKSVEIDSDTMNDLNCANGEVAKWNGITWVCAADDNTDTQLSEAQVDGYVANGPLNLDAGTTLGGASISTGPHTASLDWTEVSDIPEGFADGTDDMGITSESDPTVAASVKDGVDWSELSGIPAGFSDDIDNDLLGGLACTSGEFVKWNGSAWVCASNEDMQLSESEVEDYVTNGPLDLATGSTLDGATGGVPIGAVIDWWRPDSSWPIPNGFQICDGSTVNDPDSPLFGKTLPNLTNRFILGVTNVSNIGMLGGKSDHDHSVNIDHDHGAVGSSSVGSHNHSVNPPVVNTNSTGSHSHSVDVPNYSSIKTSNIGGVHKHKWVTFRGANNSIYSWDSIDTYRELIDWGNGLGSEGDGIWPIAIDYFGFTWDWSLYTDKHNGHNHTVPIDHNHPAVGSSSAGSHSHGVDIPNIGTTSVVSHSHSVNLQSLGTQNKTTTNESSFPPYYGMLKIMRIR